ncbi:flagellin lysine-N-methylase [Brevibacillus reuszeri]|uniref:flagellin lysine-N-methylase n=1 Tax=Brevibacillus reuszeri TaxID=54915 RepID=UPI0028964B9A|nr:flagellin lysine-N-methylase [Brevibacillus reuszeri]
MNKRTHQTLVPQYMKDFQCIGSFCEDTCCQGWTVSIDKQTYKRYKNIRDKQFAPLIKEHITRVKNETTDFNYAKIKMDSQNACPFLNNDKMCSFQLKLGETYLSSVCSTYPRILNSINGSLEQSASLSCPEAARLALLNPDIMQFDEIELELDSKAIIGKQLDIENVNLPQHYFWNLRIFSIEVLQNRKYTIPERLLILGIFYDKVQTSIEQNQSGQIPQLIELYKTIVEDGTLNESIKAIPTSYDIQFKLVKYMMDMRVLIGVNSNTYLECVKETLEGLSYTEEDPNNEELILTYKQASEAYYLPFMANHQYLLEHYLVNYVYKNLFPFQTTGNNVFNEFSLLVLHFSMIKLHLIGMMSFYKESFTEDHVVKLIYSFARAIEHSPAYLYQISNNFKEKEMSTLAHLAILINN